MSKKTGRIISEYLEVYQWNIAFECLKSTMSQRSDDYLCAISRQSGKSHIIRKVQAFLFVFGAKHIDIREEQFSLIFLSPKKELALDQASKTMLGVDKALELFNKKYPQTPLTQNDKYWNATTKRLNITIRGKTIPYAGFDVLWATAAVSAGYTANVLFLD